MAGPTLHQSGTLSSVTLNTEYDLITAGTVVPGTYIGGVDLTNLAAGDFLVLRAYELFKTGGTPRRIYKANIAGPLPDDDMGAVNVPVSTAFSDTSAVRITLTQTLGTGRSYDYTVKRF